MCFRSLSKTFVRFKWCKLCIVIESISPVDRSSIAPSNNVRCDENFDVKITFSDLISILGSGGLTHLPVLPHICVSEMSQYFLR